MTVILTLAVIEDLKTDKVSNLFQLTTFCSGLLYGLCSYGPNELRKHIILLLVVFLAGQLLFWTKALGAGDIKLWMCSSLFMSRDDVFPFLVGALVLAIFIGYGKRVFRFRYYPGRVHFTVPMLGSLLWLIFSKV